MLKKEIKSNAYVAKTDDTEEKRKPPKYNM